MSAIQPTVANQRRHECTAPETLRVWLSICKEGRGYHIEAEDGEAMLGLTGTETIATLSALGVTGIDISPTITSRLLTVTRAAWQRVF